MSNAEIKSPVKVVGFVSEVPPNHSVHMTTDRQLVQDTVTKYPYPLATSTDLSRALNGVYSAIQVGRALTKLGYGQRSVNGWSPTQGRRVVRRLWIIKTPWLFMDVNDNTLFNVYERRCVHFF